MKKIISMLLSVVIILGLSILAVSAETTMSITLRIEGIDANLYYKTVEVPYMEKLTIQNALSYIDNKEDGITIKGVDAAYITDINGETSAKFGGWDGWMYKVNDLEASVGIDGYELKDGDQILLYYGDPYGVGMQYPVVDTAEISDGILKFTSSDTTYDSNYKPTVTVNPVAGATVEWHYGTDSATYTTDENGEIKIPALQLTEGNHSIQISKVGTSGIPLVLRFAPDKVIAVKTPVNSVTSSDSVSKITPVTGDKGIVFYLFCAAAALASFVLITHKKKNEK